MINTKKSFQYSEDNEFPVSRNKEVYGEKFGTLIAADQKDVWGGSCDGMAWTSAPFISPELNPLDYIPDPSLFITFLCRCRDVGYRRYVRTDRPRPGSSGGWRFYRSETGRIGGKFCGCTGWGWFYEAIEYVNEQSIMIEWLIRTSGSDH